MTILTIYHGVRTMVLLLRVQEELPVFMTFKNEETTKGLLLVHFTHFLYLAPGDILSFSPCVRW